jgi:hypothetical protein
LRADYFSGNKKQPVSSRFSLHGENNMAMQGKAASRAGTSDIRGCFDKRPGWWNNRFFILCHVSDYHGKSENCPNVSSCVSNIFYNSVYFGVSQYTLTLD